MARSAGSGKPAKTKPTRAEKKALRVAKRQKRRETFRNLRQAFTLTREADPRFLPLMIAWAAVAVAAVYVIVYFITNSLYIPIPLALLAGVVASLARPEASAREGYAALERRMHLGKAGMGT